LSRNVLKSFFLMKSLKMSGEEIIEEKRQV
jgi:hypothetical protein